MKKNLLFIALILFTFSAFSEIVPIETARKVAVNFYFERANTVKPIAKEAVVISREYIEYNNNEAVVYIFNIGLDYGYIIVSAESNTIPVLAYSFEKNYYSEKLPPAFHMILNAYKKEILYVRDKKLSSSEEITDLWDNYSKQNFKSKSSMALVSPLLGSLAWDQDCYYNALTPANNDASYCNHNPTGCVATAMAMIMKYNAWPSQGVGSYSYNHSTAAGFPNNYGTLSANFGTSTYNWAAMPNSVTSSNAEVAKIMYHCGVAVEMAYDQNGSGAFVGVPPGYSDPNAQKAFVNYFKYPNAVYHQKSSFTDTEWKNKIKTDLDAARPILYAGDDNTYGHAFILDGYQGTNNDYFHFNFGWGGYANGNFYLTNINPNSGVANNFSLNQEGVFNLIKGSNGIEDSHNQNIDIFPNPSNGIFHIDMSAIQTKNIKIDVYNFLGEKVWETNFNKSDKNLNLSNLTKGVYYISFCSDKEIISKKITIIK